MEVWDGKIAKRGRGHRAYCMCRHKDQGPYAPWNVRIATGYENMLDWWEKKPRWCKHFIPRKKHRELGIEENDRALAMVEINTGFGRK
jgi:hypothetical protein